MVQRVDQDGRDQLLLSLTDGSREPLDPELVWVGPENVLYTKVRQGTIPARFNRPAYYQAAQWVQETPRGFALGLGGKLFPLREGHPGQIKE